MTKILALASKGFEALLISGYDPSPIIDNPSFQHLQLAIPMHDLMIAYTALTTLLSQVDHPQKLIDIDYCLSIPDLLSEAESIFAENNNLSKDQINHINQAATFYMMAKNLWLATILGKYNWEEALEFVMKGKSKDYIKDYAKDLQVMAEEFQKLSELVDATFPYLPQEDPLGLFLDDKNSSSKWNKFSLFGHIVTRKFFILVSECFEPYVEVSRKKTVVELKEILDSGVLKGSKKQQFNFKHFKVYKNIKQCKNPYLALVISTADKNQCLQSKLKRFCASYEEVLELTEKIYKRTKAGKTTKPIPSYAWVKGEKKYGTSQGGYYR